MGKVKYRVFPKVAVRNEDELGLMRQSGQISAQALKKVMESAKPGVSLRELDQIAEEEILRLGGGVSFKSVPGYYWTTCLTVNQEVVHGIPRDIKLSEGDVLGIDLGAVYQSWHTDTAWSVLVKDQISKTKDQKEEEKERFLRVGEEVLWKAIAQVKEGNKIGDISSTIQKGVEGAGYSVVKSLAGHGVGREAHEEPEIPEFGKAGTGMLLTKGMTLAIEVIYTSGKGEVFEEDDGWTLSTKDGSLGGLFEMTVIVDKDKPEVITDWRKA